MADGSDGKSLLLNGSDTDVIYQTLTSIPTTTIDLVDSENTDITEVFHVNAAFHETDEDAADENDHKDDIVGVPDMLTAKVSRTAEPFYGRPGLERASSLDELMFRLRFAHLSPQVDWFDEVDATSRQNTDSNVYLNVLTTLRECPLSIREKTIMSARMRAKLDALSVASSTSRLIPEKRESEIKKRSRKKRHTNSYFSRVHVPLGLLENSIGRIAAYFGSHVASYFQFLRFLILMNAGMAIIMFLFVAIPQIVPGEVWSEDIQSGFFGELSHTIFFYGAYHNTSSTIDDLNLSYNRPLAYLMTWSVTNVLTVLLIVFNMLVSYRRIKKTDDTADEQFASQVFLGWDHSVTSHEGSKMRSIAITTEIKEILREEKVRMRMVLSERLKLWSVRIACNLLSVAVLAAVAYLIYYVADDSIKPGLDIAPAIEDFLEEYRLALLIMLFKAVIPQLLSLLLKLEKYHPRTQIKVQIARTAIFYVASLVVFLASIYSVSTQCLSASLKNKTNYCCWENEVGEQLFQVIILDLVFTLIVGLVFTGGRAVLVKFCHAWKFGYQNFDVAELVLDLVYGQALVWLGLFFAPFLALVGFLKLWILYYFHYALARTCCVPPSKVFRASRSGTFYQFLLLVTLFVCLLPMTYSVVQLQPSTSCGPFKYNFRVYVVLTDRIGESPSWIRDIFSYASTAAVIIPAFIILLLLILYYRVKSTVHKMEAKDLRYMLQLERKVEKRRLFARARLEHGISIMSLPDT